MRPSAAWTDEGIPFTAGARAWVFPNENAVVTESSTRSPDASDVHALIDLFLWLETSMLRGRGVTVVHDWRSIDEVSRTARSVFAARRREIRSRPEALVVALDVSPMTRMVIQAATMSAQVLVGAAPTTLCDDPEQPIRKLRITQPDPPLHARLRLAWRQKRRGE